MDRILFIDDEPNLLKTLRRQLNGEAYEQVFANSPEEGLELLRKDDYSVVVSDMRMPVMTGIEVLTETREIRPLARRIILTGYSEVNSVIAAINSARVHSFLVKPWDETELKAKILEELAEYRRALAEATRIEHLEVEAQQTLDHVRELEELVAHDALTGLNNRRSFEQRFVQEWRRASREGHNLALAMIDIDKFKLVNDTAGHAEGDRILAALARGLADCLRRPSDFIARYGGEEFVAILPNTNAPFVIGEKLRSAVENLAIPHPAPGRSSVVTVSVGVSVGNPLPECELKPRHLLHAADEALYVSKRNGGNRVTIAASMAEDTSVEG